MKMSRRKLFELAFGASQVALLSGMGLQRAWARDRGDYPTKMLGIWLDGGCHWETFFSPFSAEGILKYMPEPTGGSRPWGYLPSQVLNFDGSTPDLSDPGPIRKIRGPIFWNWDDPKDTRGKNPLSNDAQNYRPWGYAWADPTYKLYEKTAVLVGADQGTAAHASGVIASMCGVAGSNFRAPTVQAVIAAAMAQRFPDRPIPNVNLGGYATEALGLPAIARPTRLNTMSSIAPTLSERRDSAWLGLRDRTEIEGLAFDGSSTSERVQASVVDAALLKAMRLERGRSTQGTDALLEQLYETYKKTSNAIARDVLTVLERTPSWEHLIQDPLYPMADTACIGVADSCGPMSSVAPYDFALQLLKSELVTSVNVRATSFSNASFDTHTSDGPQIHTNHLRIALEGAARVCLEMSLTPSSTRPGKSLLDETLVYIYSDFGRTFPKRGSDHHPATCAILVGGGVRGDQMLGGYDETMNGSPMGSPVRIIEETGDVSMRAPRSQDIAATVMHAFGLEGGKDFFIPGGFGHFDGVVPT